MGSESSTLARKIEGPAGAAPATQSPPKEGVARRRSRAELWEYYRNATRELPTLTAMILAARATTHATPCGNVNAALLVLPADLLLVVLSYCCAKDLAALCGACKELNALAAAELRGHRDGVAILSDSMILMRWTPAGVWHGRSSSLPLFDLCGLYVKRPHLVNGYQSYRLAGNPHIMLWRRVSGHWVVGLKDFLGQEASCFMESPKCQTVPPGWNHWQVARWNGAWQFVPTAMRVPRGARPGHAMRAVNRFEDEQCTAASKRWHLRTVTTYAEAMRIENLMCHAMAEHNGRVILRNHMRSIMRSRADLIPSHRLTDLDDLLSNLIERLFARDIFTITTGGHSNMVD